MILNCPSCNGTGIITPIFSTTSAKCRRCNGHRFVEVDEKDLGFDPNQASYICFDVREQVYFVQGRGGNVLANGSGDQYREFRAKCLVRKDLYPKCVDYNMDEKGGRLKRRPWIDGYPPDWFSAELKPTPAAEVKPTSVTASATPAAPLERANLWTAVQAGLYDHPRETSVSVADRVTSALENSKPAVLCVGNVLYYREDKALSEAKELRERAATLISSLRSVVDECEQRLRPKKDDRVDINVRVGIHSGCGGKVISDVYTDGENGGIWWSYRCLKCSDTFQRREQFEGKPKRKPAVRKAVVKHVSMRAGKGNKKR